MKVENRLSMEDPEGLYMPTNAFDDISKAYQDAVVAEARAYTDMHTAKAAMEAAGFQVELEVIEQVGGNEKNVGSTDAARQRAYTLAREKSVLYREAREFYLSTRMDYRYHQGMVRLMDMRGQFMIAANR